MLNRRQLLKAAAVSAATAPLRPLDVLAAAPGGTGTTPSALGATFDRIVDRRMTLSPEGATWYGLDNGAHADARSLLDDRSLAGRQAARRNNATELKEIRAFDRAKLSAADRLNYDTVIYGLEIQTRADRLFPSIRDPGVPYTVFQLGGAYRSIPDFLDRQHKIENRADAEAYLARLQAFGKTLDQEIESARSDAAAGVKPPDFALDKTRLQLKALRDQSATESQLVKSVVSRAAEQKIAGDWNARATALYTKQVQPALDRQIAMIDAMRTSASADAGVWKLPDGDAYFDISLKYWTTSDLSPDEIHKAGLDLVAELSSAIDRDLRAQSLSTGSVSQRLDALSRDARFLSPNTGEARAKMLQDMNGQVAKVSALLPKYFGTLPKAKVEIRRVPPTIEAGQPLGYYNWPALDGSRPGAFYLNMRDMKELPSWKLTSTMYHETVPGHHLQLSLQTEAALPLIRKMSSYSAYIEGWALYAEQLADEMGLYTNDAFGRIGYLYEQLQRAVRLVVDTGLHRHRWSREKAIRYYTETLGDPETVAATEVERYCVWPGQACAYMLGKIVWLKSREAARARLGSQFDLRKFHDTSLLSGAVPLSVLESIVGEA